MTLWLVEDEFAAVQAAAEQYGVSDEVRVRAWVQPALDEAVRLWRQTQWDRRRRTIETNATLAATVDREATGR
mgnify:FL=1